MIATKHRNLYVPKPYPDELFFSVVGRFGRHLGLQSPKRLLTLLFGSTNVTASPDLQGQLGRLRWLFEERWNMPVLEAVMRYTLLPYYVANRSPDERERFASMLAESSASSVHLALGVCATTVLTPPALRLCTQCSAEDTNRYGEPYWHRSHQLPGVLLCPAHGIPLSQSSIPMRAPRKHRFDALTRDLVDAAKPIESVPKSQFSLGVELAKRLSVLLEVRFEDVPSASAGALRETLQERGYSHRRAGAKCLAQDLVNLYGPDFLRALDSAFKDGQSPYWLNAATRKPRRALHPLRRILLELFLEHQPLSPQDQPFGPKPWPCLNWLAPHYRQPVVTEMERFYDKDHPERTLGRFHCQCGFVYTQLAGSSEPTRPYTVVRFGSIFEQQASSLRAAGHTVNSIARLLGISWKTAHRLLRDDPNPVCDDDAGEQRIKDQSSWRDLIAANPGLGTTGLRRQHRALYARLYRTSREWLRRNTPKAQRAPSRGRVDWAARDQALALRIAGAAERIREHRPMQRVTPTAIANELDARALVHKKLHLMPLTHRKIAKVCENPEEFRVRRLRAALERFPTEPTLSQLLRAASVKPRHATPEVLEAAGFCNTLVHRDHEGS